MAGAYQSAGAALSRDGDGGAIVCHADAGIGKSRLLEAFVAEVAPDDPNVVTAAVVDYANSPFAPIVTVAESWLRTRPALFAQHPELRGAVELIGAADAVPAPPSAADRRRCFEAVAQRAIPGLREYEFRFEEATALAIVGRKAEALAIFERYGARSKVARLRDELTVKNRHGRAAHVLTARERDVARLVADGCTNREIAERLNVTEKTVETHLASIFAKVGVRARTEIGPRLEAPASAG